MKPLAHFLKSKIILPFLVFWLVTTIVLLVTMGSTLQGLEEEKNELILASANETLKSPISLGSFVEIKSRLYSLNKKYSEY